MGLALSIALFLIIADQISKQIILQNVAIGERIPVIDGFFSIFHIRNRGAAWGFLAEHEWGISLLTLISIFASILILILIIRNNNKILRLFLAMVLGGSIGNLIDRIRFNNVVDFLSLKFGNYYFPTFNIADMSIVIGGILLILYLLKNQHEIDRIVFLEKRKLRSESQMSEPQQNENHDNAD